MEFKITVEGNTFSIEAEKVVILKGTLGELPIVQIEPMKKGGFRATLSESLYNFFSKIKSETKT